MKATVTLAAALFASLLSGCLFADTIPDPKISLAGGSGSTPVGLGAFSFGLNQLGGGIFHFCNNTPFGSLQTSCASNGLGTEGDAISAGVAFDSMSVTTEFPAGQTHFTCESDLFAFCTFTLNSNDTLTVDFFGTGFQDGDGVGFANFGGGSPPQDDDIDPLTFFPGIPPGTHFRIDFNNNPFCRPTPDHPCPANWVPDAQVVGQANVPEPGSWILLATAIGLYAWRKPRAKPGCA